MYQTALLRTFQRAVFVCILCLAIGYPIAYFLSQIKSLRKQIALFILVLAPFWTAYLIRVIAWSPVLGQNGAINYLAGKLGVGPFDFLLYSDFAVNLTLVQLYVLFMVTPIFFQLAAIDHSAVEAAKDLGASPFKVFREVILPLSLPGVMIGFIFIFVLVMGDFATVRFIGGSTVDSVGNEVNVYYNNVDPADGRGRRVDPRRRDDGRRRDPAASSRRSATRSRSSPRPNSATARSMRSASGCSRPSLVVLGHLHALRVVDDAARARDRHRRGRSHPGRASTSCSAASCSACSGCSSPASSCSCTGRRS